ncbi:MAG: hypothetical protein NT133_00905 [Alphaproteobacteria bacterium]|nr:hypothetical protein [Alphaproteobacteria bacterium]
MARIAIAVVAAWVVAAAAVVNVTPALAAPPVWAGFGGNAQHIARAPAGAQDFVNMHWTAKVDEAPQLRGGQLLIHYGSPMITALNNVLIPVKGTATGGFRVDVRNGKTGALFWSLATDWAMPAHNWAPPLPAVVDTGNRLYVAGAGGSLIRRTVVDQATGALSRVVFYGLGEYQSRRTAYNRAVQISTPLTSDASNTIFFGFTVTGATNAGLKSGIARVTQNGTGAWTSAATASGDATMTQVAMNCAPALSPDGRTVYIAVSNGSSGYLLGLDATTLAPRYKVALLDPASGLKAQISNDSTASPTVGPDGDVYFGVLENPFVHNDRGWLLHFSADLTVKKTPGSFGWDNTASIVPTALIPSYTGPSSYLLMTKYNNYHGLPNSGDGRNRIAIIDPNQTQADPYSSATVMKDIQTILAPTQEPGEPAGVVYEWCLNSAVVDAVNGVVIANSEDGRVYRWDLATNTLTQSMTLNPPVPEAYTMTLIGPDGTVYVINNSTLHAIGF